LPITHNATIQRCRRENSLYLSESFRACFLLSIHHQTIAQLYHPRLVPPIVRPFLPRRRDARGARGRDAAAAQSGETSMEKSTQARQVDVMSPRLKV